MSGLLILHSPGALSANHAHSHTRILPTLIPCSLVEHVQSKSPGAKDVQTQLRAQCPPLLFNVRKQVKEIQEERERRRLEEERIKAAAEGRAGEAAGGRAQAHCCSGAQAGKTEAAEG